MKKYLSIILFQLLFCIVFSCTSTSNIRDSDDYIEKLYSDVINSNMRRNEIYTANSVTTQFRFTSIVNIELLDTGTRRNIDDVIIIDDRGDRHLLRNSINYNYIFRNLIYTIEIMKPERFRIYYTVYARDRGNNNYEIERLRIDKIDDLMTDSEITDYQANERRIKEEEQRRVQQEELEQRQTKARATIQRALSSRNHNTIMQALNENISIVTRNRDVLRDDPIIDEAILLVAKIITRNNNIRLGDFNDTWSRYFYLFEKRNSNIFDTSVIYYMNWMRPTQIIDGMLLIRLGDYIEDSILLRNIPNPVIRRDGAGIVYPIPDVFMQYVGLLPLRLTSGRTMEIPAFNVLYYYQGNN